MTLPNLSIRGLGNYLNPRPVDDGILLLFGKEDAYAKRHVHEPFAMWSNNALHRDSRCPSHERTFTFHLFLLVALHRRRHRLRVSLIR